MLMCIAKCNGAKIESRYADLIEPDKQHKSAEEIKASILEGLRRAYGGGEADGTERI